MNDRGPIYTIRVEIMDPNYRRFAGERKIVPDAMDFILPKDVCDDPYVASMTGGVSKNKMRNVTADRRKLAAQIAAAITEEILSALEKQDTSNGYPR